MDRIYDIVAQVFEDHGEPLDGFVEDVVERITEYNDADLLSEEEIRELAEEFFEDEEEDN